MKDTCDQVCASRADLVAIAHAVRAVTLHHYQLETSCIETSYLFQHVACRFGIAARRMVAQVHAQSALLAQAVQEGKDLRALFGQPGYWAVAVGLPGESEVIGQSDPVRNRFIGHVVCVIDDGRRQWLIDPSADQMNRPVQGLTIGEPIVAQIPPAATSSMLVNPDGVRVRYELFPQVRVPMPRTALWLDRAARGLAAGLRLDRVEPAAGATECAGV